MSDRLNQVAAGLGTVLIVFSAVVRTVVMIDPMPVWSMDPLTVWVPQTGLGPTALLGLDLLGILGAAAILLGVRKRVRAVPVAFLLLGMIAVVIHSLARSANAEVGMPWAFAVSGGVALAHLPRVSMWRTVALATILALAVMLVGKGIVQVYIEHPATVANYQATRETFLQSQGWTTDSPMARNYERRLYQPEASGWFGLSNVYGSFMASMALALISAAYLTLRARIQDRRVPVVLLLAAAFCIPGLVLSHSKGAAGAGIVGAIALIAAILYQRTTTKDQRAATENESIPNPKKTPSNSAQLSGEKDNTHRLETGHTLPVRLIVAAVPTLVLLGVAIRGLLGQRLSELSILFRWFYMEGATRIFLDRPILGVGPAGFKDAYLIFKPPISPEEVTSAHNLLFDWLATLGVFSLGWILLFALACRQIGVMLSSNSPPPTHEARSWDERAAILTSAGVLAAIIGVSAFVERMLLTPEMGIVRAAGLLGGLAVAASIVRAARTHPRAVELGAVGAALVLLAHLQIEVTGVWAGAAPMAGVLIGLACAAPNAPANPVRGCPGVIVSVSLLAAAVIIAGTNGVTLRSWEVELNRASRAVEPIAEAVSTLEQTQPGSPAFEEAVRAVAALASSLPARNGEDLAEQIAAARTAAASTAAPNLIRASEIRPMHAPTRQAAVRTLMRLAQATAGPQRQDWLDRAIALSKTGTVANPDRTGSWRLLANTLDSGIEDDPKQLREAYTALTRAAALDPYGLSVSLKLVDLAGRLGRIENQKDWARRALKINSDLQLDPLRQLTDTERADLERLIQDE